MHLPSLEEVADHVDGFLLDAFGVLNVGETPIPGAVARHQVASGAGQAACGPHQRRELHPRAASGQVPPPRLRLHRRRGRGLARCRAWRGLKPLHPAPPGPRSSARGDSFRRHSRRASSTRSPTPSALDDWPTRSCSCRPRAGPLPCNPALMLGAGASARARFVIANPDLVAPREGGLTLEPGLFGHATSLTKLDRSRHTGSASPLRPRPSPKGSPGRALPPGRLAMVGDTLHTDVLGGAAAGCRSVLVTDHGLFAGLDAAPFIADVGDRAGLHPADDLKPLRPPWRAASRR
jgi:glycerol 3-phosphatase-2